jgi:hypothetical protein
MDSASVVLQYQYILYETVTIPKSVLISPGIVESVIHEKG